MRRSPNAFHLCLLTIPLIFVFSSCMTNSGLGIEMGLLSSETLEPGTDVTGGESETTTTVDPTSTRDYENTTAQEAAEAYYELMSAQRHAEAYQMLSPSMPHRKTLEEFVLEAKMFYVSYKLLSVESFPVWSATLIASLILFLV